MIIKKLSVFLKMDETKPHNRLIVDRTDNLDTLELQVEAEDDFFRDKISQLQQLRQKIQQTAERTIGMSILVKLIEPKTIESSEGKSQRVIDKRNLN